MKNIRDCVTKWKDVGECEIDVDKAIKHFNLCCRIYERNDKWEIAEYSLRMKKRTKFAIHKEDALKIINALNLRSFTRFFLGTITAYVPVGI